MGIIYIYIINYFVFIDEFEYASLTKETFEGGMYVMRNAFFKDENVCIGVELHKEPGAADELLELCRRAALDGVTIVCIEKSTGKVVGASFNKLQVNNILCDEKKCSKK